MKLSPHQIEIVKKIETGEVFDIYSYLHVFKKGIMAKYDQAEIEHAIADIEKGRTYRVLKPEIKNGQIANYVLDPSKQSMDRYNSSLNILIPTEEQCVYQEAEISCDISEITVNVDGMEFSYNFLINGVYIVEDFIHLKDFLTLWSYLKRESLIFEAKSSIDKKDIGVFFETKEKAKREVNEGNYPVAATCLPLGDLFEFEKERFFKDHGYYYNVPIRRYSSFVSKEWQFNEANYRLCKEYIGVRIAANSALRIYIQNGCRTDTEINQRLQLIVAWCAVVISLIFGLTTILQSFHDNNDDVLSRLSSQVAALSQNIIEMESVNNSIEIEPMTSGITSVFDNIIMNIDRVISLLTNEQQDFILHLRYLVFCGILFLYN